jgi:hypothetical protein
VSSKPTNQLINPYKDDRSIWLNRMLIQHGAGTSLSEGTS